MRDDKYSFSDDPNWEKGFEESDVFVIIGTEHYFSNPKCFEEAWRATKRSMPAILFLKNGVKIPEGFPLPKDIKIVSWDGTKEKLRKLIEEEEKNQA